jgi:hypothetical protein
LGKLRPLGLLQVYTKYGKIWLFVTASLPGQGNVQEQIEHRRCGKSKVEAQNRPKLRLRHVTKTVQELKADREALETSAAKSYINARVVHWKLEEVKVALEASQAKKNIEWTGEQTIVERTKWCEEFKHRLLEADTTEPEIVRISLLLLVSLLQKIPPSQ